MIDFLFLVGCQISFTSLQTSRAYSNSVPVKLSGLYWNCQFVFFASSDNFFTKAAPSVAILVIPFLSLLKTTFL